jgi:hypothetical protein
MQPFSIHEVGARAMLPPRDILVSQWDDENCVLTGAAAAERGRLPFRRAAGGRPASRMSVANFPVGGGSPSLLIR